MKRRRLWAFSQLILLLMSCSTACSSENDIDNSNPYGIVVRATDGLDYIHTNNNVITFVVVMVCLVVIIALLIRNAENEKKWKKRFESQKKRMEAQQEWIDSSGAGSVVMDIIDAYEAEKKEHLEDIEALQRNLRSAVKRIHSLNAEIEMQKELYARIQAMHPEINFAEEMKAMKESLSTKQQYELSEKEKKDRAAASVVLQRIKFILENNVQASRETYQVLHGLYRDYSNLTENQRAMLSEEPEIPKLQYLLSVARSDYDNYHNAKVAEEKVRSILDNSVEEEKLEEALRYYKKLSPAQKAYFDAELLQKLNQLWSEIKHLHDNTQKTENSRHTKKKHANPNT